MKRSTHIDAHVHADGLSDADLELMARFGVEQVLVCAHDGAIDRRAPSAAGWLAHFDRLLTVEGPRLRRHGLWPVFALGVHPAHAPWRGLEELLHRLPAYLSHPAVVALGTLGLKTGDDRERWVLGRQLELARDLRRPVVIASSPLRPMQGLKPLVALVKQYDLPPHRVLIEHVTPRMLPLLRACGFSIALEASPGRLPAEEIVALIRRYGPERFLLTSHAGEGAADVLAVPQLVSSLLDAGLSAQVIERVARHNALRFVGRDEPARRVRTA